MATIKLSAAKSAGAAISYAEGKNKLGKETKDWLREQGVADDLVNQLQDRAVAIGGENIDVEHVRGQMRATRELFRKNTGIQAHRVIQSFPTDDLNAANPADWERANALGVELGRLIAPGHEVAVYTHIDGEGHKLHNHIIINAPDLETGEKYHYHNDFARVTKLENQVSREHGLSVLEKQNQHERRTIAERHTDGYVWKDDLRSRIDAAMSDPRTSDFKSFWRVLGEKGVDIRLRGQNVSYTFLDPNKARHVSRGTKLGASYEKGAIQDELARRTEQLGQITGTAERLQQSAVRGAEKLQSRARPQPDGLRAAFKQTSEHAASAIRQSAERVGSRLRTAFDHVGGRIDDLKRSLDGFAKQISGFAEQRLSQRTHNVLMKLRAMNKAGRQRIADQRAREQQAAREAEARRVAAETAAHQTAQHAPRAPRRQRDWGIER